MVAIDSSDRMYLGYMRCNVSIRHDSTILENPAVDQTQFVLIWQRNSVAFARNMEMFVIRRWGATGTRSAPPSRKGCLFVVYLKA
jgi:hypothetical protein